MPTGWSRQKYEGPTVMQLGHAAPQEVSASVLGTLLSLLVSKMEETV